MPPILLVARTLPWHIQGGMEAHAWNLARALAREGHPVTIYTTAFDHRRGEETRDGVRIVSLPHLPRNHEKRAMWRRWGRFARAAEREFARDPNQYGSILSEMFHAWRIFRTPKAAKARRCYILHGTTLQDYRYDSRPKMLASRGRLHPRALAQALWVRGRLRRERRVFLPAADAVVAVSPWVAEHLEGGYGVARERIRIIGNGIDPPTQLPSRAEARRRLGLLGGPWVLFLGRLEEAKGPQRVLDAARQEPSWQVAIVGDGPMRETLASNTQPRTRMVGRVTDAEKWDWLAAADVLALPSENEGQPIVILEAIAAGTPVATTRDWVPIPLRDAVEVGNDPRSTIRGALQRQKAALRLAGTARAACRWAEVAREVLRA